MANVYTPLEMLLVPESVTVVVLPGKIGFVPKATLIPLGRPVADRVTGDI